MCIFPKIIENPKYKPNRKNKGIPPKPTDRRLKYIEIKCGRCPECRKAKTNEWKIRLIEELKVNPNAIFVTMTFSDESLRELQYEEKYPNKAPGKAIELFRKKWYKMFRKPLRHFLITERGDQYTERIHLHGLIWTDISEEMFERIWRYGWVYFGYETSLKTINYIMKYITKQDEKHPEFMGKIFASKGMGKTYIDDFTKKTHQYKGENTREQYRLPNGFKTAMPQYLREKFLTSTEREELRLKKMDKGEKWINGYKILINSEEGRQEAYQALKHAQGQYGKVTKYFAKKKRNLDIYASKLKNLLQ